MGPKVSLSSLKEEEQDLEEEAKRKARSVVELDPVDKRRDAAYNAMVQFECAVAEAAEESPENSCSETNRIQ